jgi:hypothetical protein
MRTLGFRVYKFDKFREIEFPTPRVTVRYQFLLSLLNQRRAHRYMFVILRACTITLPHPTCMT